MHICGAKFQELCFNISKDIIYSVFSTSNRPISVLICRNLSCKQYDVVTAWSNLHNRKTSISLKRKKDISKRKLYSFVFRKAFEICRNASLGRNYFSCHIHFQHCLQLLNVTYIGSITGTFSIYSTAALSAFIMLIYDMLSKPPGAILDP